MCIVFVTIVYSSLEFYNHVDATYSDNGAMHLNVHS